MKDLEKMNIPYHLPKPGAKVKKDSKGNLVWTFNSLYPNHEILFRRVVKIKLELFRSTRSAKFDQPGARFEGPFLA